MKKALVLVISPLTLILGTLIFAVTPAVADTPRCATYSEFRQVANGMTRARVRRIMDISGQFADGGAGGYTRYYGSCRAVSAGGGDGGAYVTFNGRTNRVADKRWIGYV